MHTTLGRHLPTSTVAQNNSGVSELEETSSECRVIKARACNADSTKHASGGAEVDPAGTALASGQPGKPEVSGYGVVSDRRVFKDYSLLG